MPTIGPAFEPLPDDPGERAEVEQLRGELQDQLDRGATHAFSPSFLLAALLGLLALIPIAPRRGGSSCERRSRAAGSWSAGDRRLAGPGRRLPRRRRLLLRAGEDPGPLQAPRPGPNPAEPRRDRQAVHALGPRRRRLRARGEPRGAGPGAGHAGGPRTLQPSATGSTTRNWPRRSAPAWCGRSTTPKKPARCSRSSPARCAATVEEIPLDQAIELVQRRRSVLGNLQSFLGPAGDLLENCCREPGPASARLEPGAQSRVARQTQSIASGCSGSRAQSAQRGILCRSSPWICSGLTAMWMLAGKTASSRASSHQRAEAAGGAGGGRRGRRRSRRRR